MKKVLYSFVNILKNKLLKCKECICKADNFKLIFTGLFLILAILKIFFDWFRYRIDSTVIVLFIIAFLPWLTKYIKTLEAFGIKTELVSPEKKNKIEENSSKLSLNKKEIIKEKIKIDESKPRGSKENPFVIESINFIYESRDIIEKLVLIRWHIEKMLKKLCEKNNLIYSQKRLRQIVEMLRKSYILKNNVCNLILDLLPVLNKAVHSDVSYEEEKNLQWVLDSSAELLTYLEIAINDPNAYWRFPVD